MNKKLSNPDDERISDLDKNLEDNLYSKIKSEDDFQPPNLSKDEFKKLWSENQTNKSTVESTEEHTTRVDGTTDSKNSQIDSNTTLVIDQNLLIKALEQSLSEINSKAHNECSEQTRRGFTKNNTEQIVRVIRIPLSKHMEDHLISIRRLLNKRHQVSKPREVIDDHKVLLALLHWASEQIDTDNSE